MELEQIGVQTRFVKHLLGYELRCAPPCALMWNMRGP